jgi:hypothetical protein
MLQRLMPARSVPLHRGMTADNLYWAFGPEHLQRLGAIVMEARVRLACLREMPEDADNRSALVRLAGAIVGHADREGWHALGALAGPMVRLWSTRRDGDAVFDAIDQRLGEIEQLVHDRIAHS